MNEDREATKFDLVQFIKGDGEIVLKANAMAKILLISGQQIEEPLVTHGPFVMNTQTEILEAMRDYKDGKMGFLY